MPLDGKRRSAGSRALDVLDGGTSTNADTTQPFLAAD